LTGQAGQDSQDRTSRGYSRDRKARKRNRGQDDRNMTSTTGQPGHGNWDRTTVVGQSG
jgi:hypothetical protein